jgi:hypothetical protein
MTQYLLGGLAAVQRNQAHSKWLDSIPGSQYLVQQHIVSLKYNTTSLLPAWATVLRRFY